METFEKYARGGDRSDFSAYHYKVYLFVGRYGYMVYGRRDAVGRKFVLAEISGKKSVFGSKLVIRDKLYGIGQIGISEGDLVSIVCGRCHESFKKRCIGDFGGSVVSRKDIRNNNGEIVEVECS